MVNYPSLLDEVIDFLMAEIVKPRITTTRSDFHTIQGGLLRFRASLLSYHGKEYLQLLDKEAD